MNDAFRQIICSAAIREADLILITGDVTDRGELKAWETFWSILDAAGLTKKVLVIPGNHDVGCLGLGRIYGKAGLQMTIEGLRIGGQPTAFPWAVMPNPGIAIFGLNSNNLQETRATGTAGGELSYFELERLARLLYKYRDASVKIVTLHHSPNITSKEVAIRRGQQRLSMVERLSLQLPQQDRRALRLLCLSHHVRLILHGHVHLDEDRRVGGLRIAGAGATTEPSSYEDSHPLYSYFTYAIHESGNHIQRRRNTVYRRGSDSMS